MLRWGFRLRLSLRSMILLRVWVRAWGRDWVRGEVKEEEENKGGMGRFGWMGGWIRWLDATWCDAELVSFGGL